MNVGRSRQGQAAQQAALADFGTYLDGRGLRLTRQRRIVAGIFFSSDGHLSAEEIVARVRAQHAAIGPATVYRTLKLLREAGLARGMSAVDGRARYEPPTRGAHHDHMICSACGRIEEFENEEIETLQRTVAEQHGFAVVDHRLELYGICGACRSAAS